MNNITWEEYFASLPDDEAERARKQFELPFDDFIDKVKCCHNCLYWDRDYSLMGDYAYNMCPVLSLRGNDKYRITRWDYYCNGYDGTRTEENLLFGAYAGEKEETK